MRKLFLLLSFPALLALAACGTQPTSACFAMPDQGQLCQYAKKVTGALGPNYVQTAQVVCAPGNLALPVTDPRHYQSCKPFDHGNAAVAGPIDNVPTAAVEALGFIGGARALRPPTSTSYSPFEVGINPDIGNTNASASGTALAGAKADNRTRIGGHRGDPHGNE